mmetsp:Transcript_36086/g.103860  ORF Transcript_36086/g.103860 Transcript_36086/m.103860 type:complete len:201 (+) Transcript_36086:130-732(+)
MTRCRPAKKCAGLGSVIRRGALTTPGRSSVSGGCGASPPRSERTFAKASRRDLGNPCASATSSLMPRVSPSICGTFSSTKSLLQPSGIGRVLCMCTVSRNPCEPSTLESSAKNTAWLLAGTSSPARATTLVRRPNSRCVGPMDTASPPSICGESAFVQKVVLARWSRSRISSRSTKHATTAPTCPRAQGPRTSTSSCSSL